MSTYRTLGTDTSGRPIRLSPTFVDWWDEYRAALGFTPVITQGGWQGGAGASASAGTHEGDALDLRVWDRTGRQIEHMVRVARQMGAAAWLRNKTHGGFTDAHVHLVPGHWAKPSPSALRQWDACKDGRDGLASNGRDYHPYPLDLNAPEEKMLLACWNLKQGRGDKIRPGLNALNPAAVIGLLECNGNHDTIDNWRNLHGYPHRITALSSAGREARSSSLLVKRGVRIHDRGLIEVKGTWRGPYRGRHDGRVFPWVTVGFVGQRVTVVAVHMPWSRSRNPLAWLACTRALLAFVRATDGPVVLMGDWNLSFAARGTGAIRRFAKWAGLRHVPTGAPIDYALSRGIDLKGHRLDAHGSDHPAIGFTRKR